MTLNLLKRAEKGSALTSTEHDDNFTAIETEVNAKQDTSSLTEAVQDVVGAMVSAAGGSYDDGAGTITLPSGGSYEVATFADLPDPTTVTAGRVYVVLAAIVTGGVRGTQWASDGTVWRPVGQQVIWVDVADNNGTTGGSATEEILKQVQFPASCLSGCREIQIRTKYLWSGTDTNARGVRIRLGTAGTTSDTVVAAITNAPNNARMQLLPVFLMPRSTTSVRRWGVDSTAQSQLVSPDAASSSTNASADLTVPNLSSALWVSLTHQSGASPTATATLSAVSIVVS